MDVGDHLAAPGVPVRDVSLLTVGDFIDSSTGEKRLGLE
jgi:hypothetical protein